MKSSSVTIQIKATEMCFLAGSAAYHAKQDCYQLFYLAEYKCANGIVSKGFCFVVFDNDVMVTL